MGSKALDGWVGTTIKINPSQLQGARGLRIGIYPERDARDRPRHDDDLNLIRLPLPYDGEFMEVFYKAFFLIPAFLHADAKTPRPVDLPDAEDRVLTEQLVQRREYPILEVVEALGALSQRDLLEPAEVEDRPVNATLSQEQGLQTRLELQAPFEAVSVTPIPRGE